MTSICSKPRILDRFIISTTESRPHTYNKTRGDIKPVRKALFGPVDHEETRSFLEKELSRIQTTESVKWNYDFKNERILSPNGAYLWRPATPQKMLRPIKRPSSPIVISNSDELYAQPKPIVVKPTPIRAKPFSLDAKPHQSKQRQITEFMSVRKSTTSALKKPSSSLDSSSIIPAKKAKLNS